MQNKTDEINLYQSNKRDDVQIVDRPTPRHICLKFDHGNSEIEGRSKKQCCSFYRELQNSRLNQLCTMED